MSGYLVCEAFVLRSLQGFNNYVLVFPGVFPLVAYFYWLVCPFHFSVEWHAWMWICGRSNFVTACNCLLQPLQACTTKARTLVPICLTCTSHGMHNHIHYSHVYESTIHALQKSCHGRRMFYLHISGQWVFCVVIDYCTLGCHLGDKLVLWEHPLVLRPKLRSSWLYWLVILVHPGAIID